MVVAFTAQSLSIGLIAKDDDGEDTVNESFRMKEYQMDTLRDMVIACNPGTSEEEELSPRRFESTPLLGDATTVSNESRSLSRSSSADVNAPSIEMSDESGSLDEQSSVLSFLSEQEQLQEDFPEPMAETSVSNLSALPLQEPSHSAFMTLRITYLLVTLVIMLADGLQGE